MAISRGRASHGHSWGCSRSGNHGGAPGSTAGARWERNCGTQEGGDNRQSLGQGPQECLKQDAQCSLGPALGQTFILGLPEC